MIGSREYRIYTTAGLATFWRDLHCTDDEVAIEQAARLFPTGVVEVWQGDRLVSRRDVSENADTSDRGVLSARPN
jgi:hypothetical protein